MSDFAHMQEHLKTAQTMLDEVKGHVEGLMKIEALKAHLHDLAVKLGLAKEEVPPAPAPAPVAPAEEPAAAPPAAS